MASVGSLHINLTARTAAFQRGMQRAGRTVRGFGGMVRGISRRLFSLQGALVGAAGAGGLVLLTRQSLKSIDAIAKLSDRIGETTQNIVGLQHAANITGAGAEKLAAGLDVMAKRLGEAAIGTGTAAKWLDEMGLNVDALLSQSPAQQFRTLADAISALPTASERAAATAALFSRANQDLVNTLMLGSAGLDQMQKEAEALGLTFDRATAAKVEQANDAITRMQSAFTGLGRIMAGNIAPYLQEIARRVAGFVSQGNGMGGAVTGAFELVARSVAFVFDVVESLKYGFELLRIGALWAATKIVEGYAWVATKLADVVEWATGARLAFLDVAQDVSKQMGNALAYEQKQLENYLATTESYGTRVTRFFDEIERGAQSAGDATATATANQAAADRAAAAERAAAKRAEMEANTQAQSAAKSRLDEITQKIQAFQSAISSGRPGAVEFGTAGAVSAEVTARDPRREQYERQSLTELQAMRVTLERQLDQLREQGNDFEVV